MEKDEISRLIAQNCWRTIGIWGQQEPRCEYLNDHTHCRNCPIFAEAARGIFHSSHANADLLALTQSIYTGVGGDSMEGEFAALPFRMGAHWLCVPTENVLVVSETAKVHKLPNRSNEILRGLVAINGEVFTCISLVHLLGLPASAQTQIKVKGTFERILAIRLNRKRVAFQVDEVQSIVRYDREQQQKLDFPEKISQYFEHELLLNNEYIERAISLNLQTVENVYRAAIV